jgi:hypothetical protein
MGVSFTTLKPFSATGRYSDGSGNAAIVWDVAPVPGGMGRQGPAFKLSTSIRGLAFDGPDFDCLSPAEPQSARSAGMPLDECDMLVGCTLGIDLPLRLIGHEPIATAMRVEIDIALDPDSDHSVRLALEIGDGAIVGEGWHVEQAFVRLLAALPADAKIESCFTCGLSDYSEGGGQLSGMFCLRNAKADYRRVRDKYGLRRLLSEHSWAEWVLETHRCAEWEPRSPGAGHRG